MAKSQFFCVFEADCVPICLGEIGIDLHGVNGTGSTGDGGSMTAEPAVWHFLNTTSAAHTAHASAALHEPILVNATRTKINAFLVASLFGIRRKNLKLERNLSKNNGAITVFFLSMTTSMKNLPFK